MLGLLIVEELPKPARFEEHPSKLETFWMLLAVDEFGDGAASQLLERQGAVFGVVARVELGLGDLLVSRLQKIGLDELGELAGEEGAEQVFSKS